MPPWLARRWYDTVFWSTFVGFTIGHRLRVLGRRNMPAKGPVLVVANHQSHFDPVLVGLASRRYLAFVARETLFKNKHFGSLIRSLDAIPLDQTGLSREGIQTTLERLHDGKCVLIFPEGARTWDGPIAPFKQGICLLLKRVDCPVVPVGIAGAFEAWPRTSTLPGTGRIAVSIGKPIPAAEFEGMNRKEITSRTEEAVRVEYEKALRLRS